MYWVIQDHNSGWFLSGFKDIEGYPPMWVRNLQEAMFYKSDVQVWSAMIDARERGYDRAKVMNIVLQVW